MVVHGSQTLDFSYDTFDAIIGISGSIEGNFLDGVFVPIQFSSDDVEDLSEGTGINQPQLLEFAFVPAPKFIGEKND